MTQRHGWNLWTSEEPRTRHRQGASRTPWEGRKVLSEALKTSLRLTPITPMNKALGSPFHLAQCLSAQSVASPPHFIVQAISVQADPNLATHRIRA